MIRTRDFVLFLIAVKLAVIITGLQFFSVWFTEHVPLHLTLVDSEPATYSAAVVNADDGTGTRLEAMKARLQEYFANEDTGLVAAAEETSLPEGETATSTDEEPEPDEPVAAVLTCSGVVPFGGAWDPQRIEITDAGAMRLITEVPSSPDGTPVTRITLPKYPLAGSDTCLASDVIGIGLDGSLIRNSEYALYGVFGEATHIGYALDGYPIYGQTSNLATDSCGAVSIDGAYRYYLSVERPGVIGCFRGTPAAIN